MKNQIEPLKKITDELRKAAERWRTTTDDPHGIATSVYVTLSEIARAVDDVAAALSREETKP